MGQLESSDSFLRGNWGLKLVAVTDVGDVTAECRLNVGFLFHTVLFCLED